MIIGQYQLYPISAEFSTSNFGAGKAEEVYPPVVVGPLPADEPLSLVLHPVIGDDAVDTVHNTYTVVS